MKFTDAPTLREVAAKAGVSIMTVSRAFLSGFYVSQEARKKSRRRPRRR